MSRFTLRPDSWYAMALFGPEFGTEIRHYSPVKATSVSAQGKGSRCFDLSFFHAAYLGGVQGKVYKKKTELS